MKLTRNNLMYHAHQFKKQSDIMRTNFSYYSDFVLNLFLDGGVDRLLKKLESYSNVILINDMDNIYKELFKKIGLSVSCKQTTDNDVVINCDLSKETNFCSIKDLIQ